MQHNPFPPFTGRPPDATPPMMVTPVPPRIDVGSTTFLQAGQMAKIAQVSFSSPRAIAAYVSWDPYQNNPAASATASTSDSAGNAVGILGRAKIGLQGALLQFNFDIPWGELIALPFVCDSLEITAEIIRPVYGQGPPSASPSYQLFNDPPLATLPVGVTLPNAGIKPGLDAGFVAVTGMVGDGSLNRPGATQATRRALLIDLAAGQTRLVPLAYGATRMKFVCGDPLVTFVFATSYGATDMGPFTSDPTGSAIDLPLYAAGIKVTNGAAADRTAEVIQYLGF